MALKAVESLIIIIPYVLVLILGTKISESKTHCSVNETWKNQGADCENCVLYRRGVEVDCQLTNETKCYCKDSYIRLNNTTSNCVLREDCPLMCGENEEAKKCSSVCQSTCSTIKRTPCPMTICSPGCECLPGYIRDDQTKKCIPIKDCKDPKCYGSNEIYTNLCGCDLVKNCQNPFPTRCPKMCKTDCFCKEGYLRDGESSKCVKEKLCVPEPQ